MHLMVLCERREGPTAHMYTPRSMSAQRPRTDAHWTRRRRRTSCGRRPPAHPRPRAMQRRRSRPSSKQLDTAISTAHPAGARRLWASGSSDAMARGGRGVGTGLGPANRRSEIRCAGAHVGTDGGVDRASKGGSLLSSADRQLTRRAPPQSLCVRGLTLRNNRMGPQGG